MSNTLRKTIIDDLENLEKGYKEMLAQQQQLARALDQQSGGIQYAKMLLEKLDAQEQTKPDVQGLPEGMEALEVEVNGMGIMG